MCFNNKNGILYRIWICIFEEKSIARETHVYGYRKYHIFYKWSIRPSVKCLFTFAPCYTSCYAVFISRYWTASTEYTDCINGHPWKKQHSGQMVKMTRSSRRHMDKVKNTCMRVWRCQRPRRGKHHFYCYRTSHTKEYWCWKWWERGPPLWLMFWLCHFTSNSMCGKTEENGVLYILLVHVQPPERLGRNF